LNVERIHAQDYQEMMKLCHPKEVILKSLTDYEKFILISKKLLADSNDMATCWLISSSGLSRNDEIVPSKLGNTKKFNRFEKFILISKNYLMIPMTWLLADWSQAQDYQEMMKLCHPN
jgi:hypothetical protein